MKKFLLWGVQEFAMMKGLVSASQHRTGPSGFLSEPRIAAAGYLSWP